jgi:hypothetical protein
VEDHADDVAAAHGGGHLQRRDGEPGVVMLQQGRRLEGTLHVGLKTGPTRLARRRRPFLPLGEPRLGHLQRPAGNRVGNTVLGPLSGDE